MFRIVSIAVLLLTSLPLFAQPLETATTCRLSEAPVLGGFRLGQPVQEIDRIVPAFSSIYEKEKAMHSLSEDKEVGWQLISSSDLFYVDNGNGNVTRSVPRQEFEDTDFIWHFLDGKLIFLSVNYLKLEPTNIKGFVKQVAEKTGLPRKGWTYKGKYSAELKCSGFKVNVWTGLDAGRDPSVMLTDTRAEAELQRRRKAFRTRTPKETSL